MELSFPALISHPPPKPEQRAGRHQRLQILLPAANKTYLSLPSHSPCPLSVGTEHKDPLALPEHLQVVPCHDRVTRWTLALSAAPSAGPLSLPEPAEL